MKIPKSMFLCVALMLVSLAPSGTLAQKLDLEGTWAGTLTTDSGTGGLEVTFHFEGDRWKGAIKMRLEGQELTADVQDLVVSGNDVSFTAQPGPLIKFAGKVDSNKFNGAAEAFRDATRIGAGTFSLSRGAMMPAVQNSGGGQVADENFNAKVDKPAYSKDGPRVLFDEAHNNFHTATGRYKPFADLIGNDGYQITSNKEKFTPELLKGYNVLVISNALGMPRMADPNAANPAFTDAECDAVREWVKSGRALLLIADHAPMGSANQILGERFGIEMSKMFTIDEQNSDKESGNSGFIVYTRESGRLADHPITRGRDDSERVNKIIAFTGQSLKGPPTGVPFMKLADTAQDTMGGQSPKFVSAAGRAQGIALAFGKGRAVFLGEAGMLSAQLAGPQRRPFGMNRPGIDNRQLALNIMHWLTRVLPEK